VLLDPFIPNPDVRSRQEIVVRAPAGVVLDVARGFDMQSIPGVRAIIWLRGRVLGATAHRGRAPIGLVGEMLGMGWGRLAEERDRYFVAGAACQPWRADVVFSPIPPERFAAFADPDRVKIAWTLEAETIEPALTRFATETRAVATDESARRKFRRYWRAFGVGVPVIRWLLLPALRREAELRWRATPTPPAALPRPSPPRAAD